MVRAEIAEDLKLLQKVYREKPSQFMNFLQIVFDAKADEFVNVFSESFPRRKSKSEYLIERNRSGKFY